MGVTSGMILEQCWAMIEFGGFQPEAGLLDRLQDMAISGMDTLLPALLNHAFKGEF